jgi:signal transduction histidine kinase
LVLPYAAVRTADGALVLASGEPGATLRAVPLPWHGPGTAELVVGLRPGDLRLGRADEQVLRLVAPLLAQTLRARAAAAEQRTSRELTIRAVEEERRRLRRDLHDGLGPRLSGIAFSCDAARNTVRSQPDVAEQLLTAVRREATTAMAEIRQLVYGMRPPALDELGLLPALQQHAATLRTTDERLLQVRYEVDDLPPLQAAWEVAVYRIVTGALDNVARHSGADRAAVRMSAADGALLLEVRDEGRSGPPPPGAGARPGVGTSSMRERAAELGGTLASGPDGRGWLVRSVLPLPLDP